MGHRNPCLWGKGVQRETRKMKLSPREPPDGNKVRNYPAHQTEVGIRIRLFSMVQLFQRNESWVLSLENVDITLGVLSNDVNGTTSKVMV